MRSFDPKAPEEVIVCSLDFSELLDADETIQSATVSSQLQEGADTAPEAILAASADITASPIIRQKVSGGCHGATYRLVFLATTSAGRTLLGSALLPVLNEGA